MILCKIVRSVIRISVILSSDVKLREVDRVWMPSETIDVRQ